MRAPVLQASVPWKVAETQLGAGFSLTPSALTTFPGWRRQHPPEGFLGNPGRKRKPLGGGQEK